MTSMTAAHAPLRVTGILRAANLIDVSFASDEARDRGTAVHAATQFLDDGDLDLSSVHEAIAPALARYQEFKAHVQPEILAVEEEVEHSTLRYRGRLDRRIAINGREGILDVKGVFRAAWQGVQLAGYAACFPRPMARWTLHLPSDGTDYRLIEHTDRDDWRVFQAALSIASWKARHE